MYGSRPLYVREQNPSSTRPPRPLITYTTCVAARRCSVGRWKPKPSGGLSVIPTSLTICMFCLPACHAGRRAAAASPDERGLGAPGHHQPADRPPHRRCDAGVPVTFRAQTGTRRVLCLIDRKKRAKNRPDTRST